MIVVTGAESTGKSTLAAQLGEMLNRPVVAEQARAVLHPGKRYTPSDLLSLAQRQQAAESGARRDGTTEPVADTELQVLVIWWQEKFGPAPTALMQALANQSPRFYLLCAPDLAWEPDPLRENPHDRQRLHTLYHRDLDARALRYAEVRGHGKARLANALDALRANGVISH